MSPEKWNPPLSNRDRQPIEIKGDSPALIILKEFPLAFAWYDYGSEKCCNKTFYDDCDEGTSNGFCDEDADAGDYVVDALALGS